MFRCDKNLSLKSAAAAAAPAAAANRPLVRGAHERASGLEPQVRPCLAVNGSTLMCLLMPMLLQDQTTLGPRPHRGRPPSDGIAPRGTLGAAADKEVCPPPLLLYLELPKTRQGGGSKAQDIAC